MARKLPSWLKRNESGAFLVDPNIAYPLIFSLLGVKPEAVNQYWIECAYQCAKMTVQDLITGTELDPRPKMGFVIVIEADGDRKDKWALRNHPPGKGIHAATKGLEAKRHYSAIRNRLAAG